MRNKTNWNDCTLDFSVISICSAILLLKQYGSYISTIRLRGNVSPCNMKYVMEEITKCCPNLDYFDSFCPFSLVPCIDNLCALSVPFPSATSTYHTESIFNTDRVFYSCGDYVFQSIPMKQPMLNYTLSIWQFEIENSLQAGFSVTMECCINGWPVGEFMVQDKSVADVYTINMLFPIRPHTFVNNLQYLVLSLRLKNSLPFGAGAVRVSSIGRVSFLKSRDYVSFIDHSVPPFSESF